MAIPTTARRRPPTTPLTQKGRLTMPIEVRRRLRVGPTDRIEWLIEDDGAVRVQPARSVTASLRGKYKPLPGREHLSMEQLIEESLADQFDDIMRDMGDAGSSSIELDKERCG